MNRKERFPIRAPLTPIEVSNGVAVITDATMSAAAATNIPSAKASDLQLYGQRAAKILSDCCRAVALAPEETKILVFQEVATKIGEAVNYHEC